MSDITGHDKGIYLDKIATGIQQPQQLYALYSEIQAIVKIKA